MDGPDLRQTARYREMTPQEKLRVVDELYWTARRLREAYEQQQHPEWSEEHVREYVREEAVPACLLIVDSQMSADADPIRSTLKHALDARDAVRCRGVFPDTTARETPSDE
jgi:hypothetical protein